MGASVGRLEEVRQREGDHPLRKGDGELTGRTAILEEVKK